MSGSITDVPGIEVGHVTRTEPGSRTGVTVVLARAGAVAGVDVRGGGPGTREIDALSPTTLVEKIHAVCLTGGSAFGLGAAQGVMEWCREQGHGVDLGRDPTEVVPVVPAAVIFDLGRGGTFTAWPTAEDGRAAVAAAGPQVPCRGTLGAGTGAISGGLQGGIGSASLQVGEVWVAALVVLNSSGSAIDPQTGLPWVTGSKDLSPADEAEILALELARMAPRNAARTRDQHPDSSTTGSSATGSSATGSLNTVIGVIATSADLSVAEATKLASVGHDGLARAVRPAHSMFDGDTIFSLATGHHPLHLVDPSHPGEEQSSSESTQERDRYGAMNSRPGLLNAILEAGANCFADACTDAVLSARQHRSEPVGPPSYRDCAPGVFPGNDLHH
jgi:putative pantetheine hydrolase